MKSIQLTLLAGLIPLLGWCQKSYQGLFWEISGNGLEKSSYIYGTMHTADERAFQFKEGVMDAFNKADYLALELNMDSVDQMAIMSQLTMDSTHTLSNLLSEEDYLFVEKYFEDSLSTPLKMFDNMQPMFTSSMIGMKGLKEDRSEALDMYFFKEAKKQEKNVVGLEKMEEQINAFSAIPYNKQAEGLVETVKAQFKENTNDGSDSLIYYYAAGDLDKMLSLTSEYDDYDKEMQEIFTEVFLIKRNHNMADRAVQYLKTGSTFIAVGAAHLPGEEGVIELLRKKGYRVEPK